MQSAEIIAIGTEILLGQITDTNSRFLSEELARLGINCFFHTTVGDNPERIIACLKRAASRSDIVITSGGLGPTADDLTMECIADAFGSELKMDEALLAELKEFFAGRGYNMPSSNNKQAMRPVGASILPNPRGTAPGIIWELDRAKLIADGLISGQGQESGTSTIITFPGVPHELRAMWKETVAGFLSERVVGETIYSVELKHIGIGESSLAEKYASLLEGKNPTVAPYAGRGECRLRVTAKASSLAEAESLVKPVVDEILSESGSLCYGRDDDTLESVVGELLRHSKLTVALAESCTGGLVSTRLTDIPGSSEYIGLNLVTYSNEAKMNELQVPASVLEGEGAVSEACARAMARGVRRKAGADIGLAVTGIAGPGGGSEDKPVGLVYLGIDSSQGTDTKELRLGNKSSRSEIRYRTANESLNLLRLYLLERQDKTFEN
ncbi:MAG: competence/damage-inducible protein A [Cyanobacteriota/Melainabacteria group bacterium]